jgi:biopolymer transport protein ExbD/biopolymer transport protein TolR
MKQVQNFEEINITPLTDIFLVLLIIMMVVAPMLNTSGLRLSVPALDTSPDVKETPKTMTLAIGADNTFTLEGRRVSLLDLGNEIRSMKDTKPDGLVIQANPDSTHDALTQALDSAQSVGVDKIAVTEDTGSAAGAGEPPAPQQ